jgi:hypothetical protein
VDQSWLSVEHWSGWCPIIPSPKKAATDAPDRLDCDSYSRPLHSGRSVSDMLGRSRLWRSVDVIDTDQIDLAERVPTWRVKRALRSSEAPGRLPSTGSFCSGKL